MLVSLVRYFEHRSHKLVTRDGNLQLQHRVGASYSDTSGGLRVLMDQPTDPISPHDSPGWLDDRWLGRPERRRLPQGAVRTVAVVMVGILGQHRPQLPASDNEDSVQHLTPNRAHPPLRVGVRPRP